MAMPWRVWGATLNTVHGEDDFSFWLSSDAEWGAIAVADGVSATSGGGASFLAAHGFTLSCRLLRRAGGAVSGLSLARRCLDYVSRMAVEAYEDDADLIEMAKKRYYSDCSSNGKPCTEPMTLDYLLTRKLQVEAKRLPREAPPASTLIAALLTPSSLTAVISGDGYILGATPMKEETWLLWGAIPQLFEGSRLIRYVEVGKGTVGKPLVAEMNVYPGTVYIASTDGVDAATLAEVVTDLLQGQPSIEVVGHPAAYLLEQVRERSGGYEDDATIVVAAYNA